MYRTLILILTLTALGTFGAAAQNESDFDGFKLVDKTGNIRLPAKADDWIYVRGYPVLHSR
jgi:hypothetical protein